jgi:hypothetical protein
MGKKFELRKNHCGLKHLFGKLTLNARKTRWLGILSEYNLEINHIRERKIKWLMHSIGELMKCILQPLACTRLI